MKGKTLKFQNLDLHVYNNFLNDIIQDAILGTLILVYAAYTSEPG
jgi:hypothetical protein